MSLFSVMLLSSLFLYLVNYNLGSNHSLPLLFLLLSLAVLSLSLSLSLTPCLSPSQLLPPPPPRCSSKTLLLFSSLTVHSISETQREGEGGGIRGIVCLCVPCDLVV